jgi:hypothetical protein
VSAALHTPGPWIGAGPSFGDPLPRYTCEIVTEWEDEDGEVISICTLPFHHHDDENEANARLIAAAPLMYEALREIVSQIDQGGSGGKVLSRDYCITAARAAIAKAEAA